MGCCSSTNRSSEEVISTDISCSSNQIEQRIDVLVDGVTTQADNNGIEHQYPQTGDLQTPSDIITLQLRNSSDVIKVIQNYPSRKQRAAQVPQITTPQVEAAQQRELILVPSLLDVEDNHESPLLDLFSDSRDLRGNHDGRKEQHVPIKFTGHDNIKGTDQIENVLTSQQISCSNVLATNDCNNVLGENKRKIADDLDKSKLKHQETLNIKSNGETASIEEETQRTHLDVSSQSQNIYNESRKAQLSHSVDQIKTVLTPQQIPGSNVLAISYYNEVIDENNRKSADDLDKSKLKYQETRNIKINGENASTKEELQRTRLDVSSHLQKSYDEIRKSQLLQSVDQTGTLEVKPQNTALVLFYPRPNQLWKTYDELMRQNEIARQEAFNKLKIQKTLISSASIDQPIKQNNTINISKIARVVSFEKEAVRNYDELFTSGFKLIQLDRYQSEYQQIENLFMHTTRNKNLRVHNIERIVNPALETLYNLKKTSSQMQSQEHRLFHGTKRVYIDSIMECNLDYRRCAASKFGIGVSFSPIAYYSYHYCDKDNDPKVMLLCNVLVRKHQIGNRGMKLPNVGFDTTTNPELRVYVKYHDDTFLPIYKITFN